MNEPTRILHLISRFDGYGAARMLRYLAAHQAAAGRAATIATFAASDGVESELQASGVAVHVIGSRWSLDPIALARLASLCRRTPVDLTHAWDAHAAVYASITARRAPSIATWETRRDLSPHFTSALWRRNAIAMLPGVPETGPSQRDRTGVLAELDVPADARIIATAGPLVRSKRLDEAIWCFELVRVLHPTARLVIFGDGPDRPRLERYAELVSEPHCVRFAGYRSDLADLLPHADAYWQLDGACATPHALLEAMAAGVAPVASDVPAHRAAITHGETGFAVRLGHRADVARATDRLLGDRVLARRVGDAAAESVRRHWSLEKSLVAFDDLYRTLSIW